MHSTPADLTLGCSSRQRPNFFGFLSAKTACYCPRFTRSMPERAGIFTTFYLGNTEYIKSKWPVAVKKIMTFTSRVEYVGKMG